ncbi:MAG: hypothetical protein ACREGH_02510 [Minisyncoccia bacterium]
MKSIQTRVLAGILATCIGSGAFLFAAALPAYAHGDPYGYGSSYGDGGQYGSYGGYGSQYNDDNYGYQTPQQYGYSGYTNEYQPYETYWGYTPYNENPVYSALPPYYFDPYYSPFTYQTGYYGSCNGQPCGGAFMPNSPYYGGFITAPGASYY